MRNNEHLQRPLYRSKAQRAEVMKPDKVSWFRKEGATATLTVPETKNSELAKRLRLAVAQISGPKGTSVKIIEKPGPPLLQGIALKNPFRTQGCPREGCPLVKSGKPCLGKCSLEGITYIATCRHCEEQQLQA